jgi:ribosome maturation factor RimP
VNLEKIRAAAERVARSEGLEVVDVEWKIGKQRFLRVYIDRVPPPKSAETGLQVSADPFPKISHADCEKVSQQLSVILDVEELVNGPGYVLEVSSPGMDRALTKPADFERFSGRLAKVWTNQPVEEMSFLEGRITGVESGKVRLELKGKTPRTIEVPFTAIRKANLVVEF